MIVPGTENGNGSMPGQPFNLTVTRNLDFLASPTVECVLHEEILLVDDVSDLALIADHLVKVYGGDGFSIRRVQEALCSTESLP